MQNARVTAFILSELLRENLQGARLISCASYFVEFSVRFVYVFRTIFVILDPSFNRSLLRILYLKLETSVDAQIAVIH